MEKNVLIKYALDCNGRVVRVDEASKGVKYYCPECGDRLKYRHGKVRKPHFAHINGENCTNESALHAIFKKKAAELFQKHIESGQVFSLSWSCPDCGFKYGSNLLHRAKNVIVEHDLGPCRPDVALLDQDGNTVVAFEVVVSHEPELGAIRYYDENGIVMVMVILDKDEELDFNDVGSVIAERAKVSFCCNVGCRNFCPAKVDRKVIKEELTCPNCNQKFERLLALSQSPIGDFGIPDLTDAELADWRTLSDRPANIIRLHTKWFGKEMLTLRTRCACKPEHQQRMAPKRMASEYYYDHRKGGFVRRRRL